MAALRETHKEAGIVVTLKGILCIKNTMTDIGAQQRVIYYAKLTDPAQPVKQRADSKSLCATWMTVTKLKVKSHLPPPDGL